MKKTTGIAFPGAAGGPKGAAEGVTPAPAEQTLFRATQRFYLDASSPVPLYHQREKIIVDRISAEGVVGCRLPREMDLLKIFGVSANEDFCGSLYAVLEQKCGVPIEWAEEQIPASRATPEKTRHLGIQGDDVVPVMERQAFTHGN